MSSTTISRNSTNFDDISIVINSDKRTVGYPENFQVQLDSPLTRVQSMSVENIQFTSSKYLLNNGNTTLAVLIDSIGDYYELVCFPGVYTGEELAEELNNISSVGIPKILDYEWSYDTHQKKFLLKGGELSFIIISRQTTPTSTFTVLFPESKDMSPLSAILSFSNIGETIFDDNKPIEDLNNPGELMFSSTFEAHGDFVLKSQNRMLSTSHFHIPRSFSTPSNITGFEVASKIQADIRSATGEDYLITYNTNNFRFRITRGSLPFGDSIVLSYKFFGVVFPSVLGGGVSDNLVTIFQGTNEVHGTPVTHTITTSVNDLFTINEGNNNIDITLPAITSATLSTLATILQTAINDSQLINKYEITFSERTGKFRIKAIKNAGSFPTFTLVLNTASSIFGFTVEANGTIVKSDTPQFELFTALSDTISISINTNIEIPIGTPSTATIASQILEDALNEALTVACVVTYDEYIGKIQITASNGIVLFINEIEGAYLFYGLLGNRTNTINLGGTPHTADNIALFYGPQYLYIKSNALARRKTTINGVDISHQDIIGKIILDKRPISVIFNEVANLGINKLAEKTEIQTIDIRLEDEDGVLYNTNGIEWAFSLLFEKF